MLWGILWPSDSSGVRVCRAATLKDPVIAASPFFDAAYVPVYLGPLDVGDPLFRHRCPHLLPELAVSFLVGKQRILR